ncbi:hypothetical protein T439DRAFT_353194 [Meredithblackwellia eburnea MCA 4105]
MSHLLSKTKPPIDEHDKFYQFLSPELKKEIDPANWWRLSSWRRKRIICRLEELEATLKATGYLHGKLGHRDEVLVSAKSVTMPEEPVPVLKTLVYNIYDRLWYSADGNRHFTTAQVLEASRDWGRARESTVLFEDPNNRNDRCYITQGTVQKSKTSAQAGSSSLASLQHHRQTLGERYTNALLLNRERKI